MNEARNGSTKAHHSHLGQEVSRSEFLSLRAIFQRSNNGVTVWCFLSRLSFIFWVRGIEVIYNSAPAFVSSLFSYKGLMIDEHFAGTRGVFRETICQTEITVEGLKDSVHKQVLKRQKMVPKINVLRARDSILLFRKIQS